MAAKLGLVASFEIMKFTLHYSGDLRASGGGRRGARLDDKWKIRRQIHPQLKELWKSHQVLVRIANDAIVPAGAGTFAEFHVHHSQDDPPSDLGPDNVNLIEPIDVAGKSFVPLVRESMSLVCDLDILFLRRGEPGQLILPGGDIDNRIKTLLDGLRMPNDANEIGNHRVFRPTYCLLEDDSLITGINVKTDRLLDPTTPGDNSVRLIIGVTVNVIHVRPYGGVARLVENRRTGVSS